MLNQDEEPTTNDDIGPTVSLTDILKAVQHTEHEAKKAHNQDVKRFEKLFKQIGEVGDRMDTIDKSMQNALSAFLPVNTQLRVSPQTQTDGTTRLPLSVIQPQAQAHPVQTQHVPAAPAVNTRIDDEEIQAGPRRNPTRKKSSAAKDTQSVSTSKPSQASKQRVKPGFSYEDSVTNRALPPSPPKIGKPRPSKPKVNRPAKSSAREKLKEASSDDGVDEIPAVAEEVKVNKKSKKQQKSKRVKTAVNRKAAHDFDDDEEALDAEDNDDNDETSTQTARPSKKRKSSRPDPIGDVEGRFHA
jgi:hypothetical protein